MPRNRAWADRVLNVNLISGAASQNFNLLADAPTVDTLTAVRVILHLTCFPEIGDHPDGIQAIHMGVGVASLEAFNVNALPDPNISTEYPARGWLWVDTGAVYQDISTAPLNRYWIAEFKMDVRAMRKIDKGILFLAMVTDLQAGLSFDLRIVGRTRVLCLT